MQTFHSEAWLWPPACGFLCHSILVGIGFLNRVVSRGFAHIHFPCTFLFPRSFPSPLAAFVFTAQSVNILSEALALGSLRLLAFSLHHWGGPARTFPSFRSFLNFPAIHKFHLWSFCQGFLHSDYPNPQIPPLRSIYQGFLLGPGYSTNSPSEEVPIVGTASVQMAHEFHQIHKFTLPKHLPGFLPIRTRLLHKFPLGRSAHCGNCFCTEGSWVSPNPQISPLHAGSLLGWPSPHILPWKLLPRWATASKPRSSALYRLLTIHKFPLGSYRGLHEDSLIHKFPLWDPYQDGPVHSPALEIVTPLGNRFWTKVFWLL